MPSGHPGTRGTVCIIGGCEGDAYCRRWCMRHYTNWNRRGDPLEDAPNRQRWTKYVVYPEDPMECLLAFTEKTSDCWNWVGRLNKQGYGTHTPRLGESRPHRLSYRLFIGDIPKGMTVHHKCANTACVNPEHLELATHLDNNLEMLERNGLKAEVAALRSENERLRLEIESLQRLLETSVPK